MERTASCRLTFEAPAGPFTLTARADRIEATPDGYGHILDYKTGKAPSKKEVQTGFSPQLTLTAANTYTGTTTLSAGSLRLANSLALQGSTLTGGGIVFDSMNTLSGEMQRQASEFERQAANYLDWARQREEQYVKLAKELQSIGR